MWPEYDWDRAQVRSGAFHDVVLCPPYVAARLAHGAGHQQRTDREVGVLQTCAEINLSYVLPRVPGQPVTQPSRTGVLTTFVPGHLVRTPRWSEVRDAFATALAAFERVTEDQASGLPAPRHWCGAESWLDIVRGQLGRHLSPPHLRVAVEVVTDVLATRAGSELGFVHGDFGLHTMLWIEVCRRGLIDLDHACWGDPAMDIAPLIGTFGAAQVADVASPVVLERAMYHLASLPLQVAAAAELVGHHALRDHALRNFATRLPHRHRFPTSLGSSTNSDLSALIRRMSQLAVPAAQPRQSPAGDSGYYRRDSHRQWMR